MENTLKFEEALPFVKKVAFRAGNAIMDVYKRNFAVELKGDNSPLTEADNKANEIIVDALKARFPHYGFLSEESKDDKNRLQKKYCWIIDPLDGTKEFVKRNGEFTVNIALARNGKSILGAVYAPDLGDLYYAAENYGAYYQAKEGNRVPIHVSTRTDRFRLLTSRSHKSKDIFPLISSNKHRIEKEFSVGSSLKGCLIARGKADMYYRFGYTMEWDTAAMQCIVEEAGGVFRQMDNTPMLYNRENSLNDKGFYILNNELNDLRISSK